MNQGDRCLVVHAGVEVEGVVKSHHQELDQVLVAVHKECGGYFEILRSPQDIRLVTDSRPASVELKDISDIEEPEELAAPAVNIAATPMDLDSEERDTAEFLASLSSSAAQTINPAVPNSWTDTNSGSTWNNHALSRSAPAAGFMMGSFPLTETRPIPTPQRHDAMDSTQTQTRQPYQPSPQRNVQPVSGEDIDKIARIMESMNASSPPSQSFRPIVYLATSPQFEDVDNTGVLLTTRPGSSLTAHTVSRPINIPVRQQAREIPLAGLSSPRHTHIAHLVLSDSTMAASLSSSTSSTSALGSLPTHLGSLSPPSSLINSATSAPVSGRRVRSDVKKCRKVYGIEHRDQWCNQCRWKKACTRFPDPLSPPRQG